MCVVQSGSAAMLIMVLADAADECEEKAIKFLAHCNKTHPNRLNTVYRLRGAGDPTDGQI
jgi:hypothetical protein